MNVLRFTKSYSEVKSGGGFPNKNNNNTDRPNMNNKGNISTLLSEFRWVSV